MFISFPVSPDLGRHIKELILTGEKSVAPKGSFYCEKKSQIPWKVENTLPNKWPMDPPHKLYN